MQPSTTSYLRWLALGLLIAAGLMLAPFAPWLILAIWTAGGARPLQRKLTALFRGRSRIAAALTTALLFAIAVPIVMLLASLAADTYAFVVQLLKSERGKELLEKLVSGKDGRPPSTVEMLASQGGRAWGILQQVAGTATRMAIGIFVYIVGVYSILVEGRGWYGWIERHVPIPPEALHRLDAAFRETGRGLFVGIGGAGLVQAVMATIAYIVVGAPQALALGVLTLVMSIIPAVGTALVWGPVAVGLALTGRPVAGIGLAVYGFAGIGTVDNLIRPYLARRGKLQLPSYVVMLAMFGGAATIGGWGLMLAPLAVRLAKEVLEILHDSP